MSGEYKPEELFTSEELKELKRLRELGYELLKPKRVPHVKGCEKTAVELALIFGCNAFAAAKAAILHDITKKLEHKEHLLLLDKYGIICDAEMLGNPSLLHAVTGACLAREKFSVSDEIYSAIRWHTTGRPEMTPLEKIIYLADYIEPTRDFDGVKRLRRLAYKNLDAAMALGLKMSIDEVSGHGVIPYHDSYDAFEYYKEYLPNG